MSDDEAVLVAHVVSLATETVGMDTAASQPCYGPMVGL